MQYKNQQSTVPTCQSHRNTQMYIPNSPIASRLKTQYRYDINDYLPSDNDMTTTLIPLNYNRISHAFSFSKRQSEGNNNNIAGCMQSWPSVNKEDENQSRYLDQEVLKAKINEINQLQQKIKRQQLDNIAAKQQHNRKELIFNEQVSQLSKQVEQLQAKQQKNAIQKMSYLQKIRSLQQNMKKINEENKAISEQLALNRKQMDAKTNNIRIFCQKYQLVFEPKLKQTYTIQVQTEKDLLKPLLIEQQPVYPFVSTFQPQSQSNKKLPNANKPQFYQLYQQQQQNHKQTQFDLNNQFTSRSQVVGGSGLKPRKPAFMDNPSNVGDVYQRNKQNDRKRINQRIEGIGLAADRSRQKNKIKNQQIQIYPVQQGDVQDLVLGILALK